MEALQAANVVTETAIFAALSPQSLSVYRRPEPRPRSSDALLPLVQTGDRRSGSNDRVPASSLPAKTPRSLLTSTPITTNECAIVWRFLCDWITAQVKGGAFCAIGLDVGSPVM